MAIIGTQDEALGQAWHVPSAPPVTQGELMQMLQVEIGKPIKTSVAAPWLIRLLGLFNPTINEVYEIDV